MRDLRQAIRALRATPVVTAVAALSLALGIGANTAIFSLVNGLVLRALPVTDPERLTLVSDTADHARAWSYPIWLQIHQRGDLFESSAAWSATRATTRGPRSLALGRRSRLSLRGLTLCRVECRHA